MKEQGSKVNIKNAATSQTNATDSRYQHTTMTLLPQQNNRCCQTTRNRRRSSQRKRVGEPAICAVGMRGFTLSGTMLGRFLWVRQHPHETRTPGFPTRTLYCTQAVIHLVGFNIVADQCLPFIVNDDLRVGI